MAASYLDNCGFNPTAGGTTDFTFSSAALGYQSPSAAGAVNGAIYRYRAQSADLTQWEIGFGAYNTGTGVLSRSTVLFNSSGTTAKISFTLAPLVAIVALAEDLSRTHSVIPNGRLTLTSGTPITTTDVTAATTVYYTPGGSTGNVIALYDGSNWVPVVFSETSLSLSGLTANTNYDIWGRISSGVLALDTTAWTNDTTRATAIAQQDSVDIKSGDATRRLLGTIRITGTTGQTEDSRAKRFVSNRYNDTARNMEVHDAAATWTYSIATYRQANANTANQLDFVCCVARMVQAVASGVCASGGTQTSVATGIGLDAIPTTTPDSTQQQGTVIPATGGGVPSTAYYAGTPGVGRHFLAWLEYGSAATTVTWQGTNLPFSKTGISGVVSN